MRVFIISISMLVFGSLYLYSQTTSKKITVKILEKGTTYPIPQAILKVDIDRIYVADFKGECSFLIPSKDSEVCVESFGYKSQCITVKDIVNFTIYMEFEHNQLDEVVVNGRRRELQNSVMQGVTSLELNKNIGNSLVESLEKIRGVSFIQNGATVAKPVIQGMYGNRIMIINNGVRQEGQSWGDDHAPEIDMNNAEYITVIKGADAVRYGSQALGGVIKLESRDLPYNRNYIKGNISKSFGSNGRRLSITGFADGTLPFTKALAWRIQATYLNSGDRKTAKYLLNNTGMREQDFSAAIGYRKGVLNVDLFYSRYDSKIGVLYTSQRGDVDLLKERIKIGRPLQIYPFTRKVDYPYQHIIHQIFRFKTILEFNRSNSLNFQYSYQTDYRDEFHARRNNLSRIPSLSLYLSSSQFDLSWLLSSSRFFKSEVGLYGALSDNMNNPGTGVVPVIPNYTKGNIGAFVIQKVHKEYWGLEAGVRFDNVKIKADGFDSYGKRYGGQKKFSNLTYNLGGNFQICRYLRFVSNLGVAWRSPHVHELYSNGLDHASGIYIIGDNQLKSERSTKWISSLIYDIPKLKFSIDGYFQWVRNYIYDEPTQNFMTIVSGTYPIFKYKQVNSLFRGIDAEIVVTPFSTFKYNSKASMIWANEKHTGRYLPYIPSFNLLQILSYDFMNKGFMNRIGVSLKHKYVAKQRRFDPSTDLIPFSPSSYNLFGLGVECDLFLGKGQSITLMIDVNNLLNKQYKEYTNRFRYYAHDLGRDLRFVCLWNF